MEPITWGCGFEELNTKVAVCKEKKDVLSWPEDYLVPESDVYPK